MSGALDVAGGIILGKVYGATKLSFSHKQMPFRPQSRNPALWNVYLQARGRLRNHVNTIQIAAQKTVRPIFTGRIFFGNNKLPAVTTATAITRSQATSRPR